MSRFAFGGQPPMRSAAYYHFGGGGLGVPGNQVPTTGEHFAGLLANDVAANGWETNDVRWRLTSFGTLPYLVVREDSRFFHPAMPDGTYSATGIVSVDGVDVGTSTLYISWGVVLGQSKREAWMSPLNREVTFMARRTEVLEDMDVQEGDTIAFNFAPGLADGETLVGTAPSDAVVTVEVYSGSDPVAATRLTGDRQVVSPRVRQAFEFPLEGVIYKLRCVAKTSTNRRLTASAYLKGIRL